MALDILSVFGIIGFLLAVGCIASGSVREFFRNMVE